MRIRASFFAALLSLLPLAASATSQSNIDLVSRMTFSGARWHAVRRDAPGQKMYLGLGKSLVILSTATPSAPTLLGWIDLGDDVMDVELVGTTAYCAVYNAGLSIVNVSNPAAPTLVSNLPLPGGFAGRAYDLAVSGNYVYVADYLGGFKGIDVSNPASPSVVWNYFLGTAYSVAVSGGYLYLGQNWPGVDVMSLSNPAAPAFVGRWPIGSYKEADEIVVSGTVAYLANRDDGLVMLNVSDPANPAFLGAYDTPGIALSVAVVGTTAYVADYYSIQTIDVTNPASPSLLGSRSSVPRPGGVVADAGSVDVVDSVFGFSRYDASDPNLPTIVGFYTAPGNSYAVAASGNTAYVLDTTRYFHIVDISNPAFPVRLKEVLLPKSPYYSVALSGSRAHTLSESWQLDTLDVSNPASPLLLGLGYQPPPNYLESVASCWPNLCIASNHGGLDVADVSNPNAPYRVGIYDTPGYALDVVYDHPYAYVADNTMLQILDLTNPAVPTLAGYYDFGASGAVGGIAYSAGRLYACDPLVGVTILDVSNPAIPAFLSAIPLGSSQKATVSGNFLYVAAGQNGLRIFDVSNPISPTSAGAFDSDGISTNVAMANGYALLTDVWSGSYLVHFDGQCLDPFEGNDRMDLAARSLLPTTFTSKICTSGDPDWYYVDATGAGLLDVDVTAATGVATDLDLFSPTRAATGTASAAGGAHARIRIAIPSAGRWFYRIRGKSPSDFSASASYTVATAHTPSGSCTAPTLAVTIPKVSKAGPGQLLTISDPNPGGSTTGVDVYRATAPGGTWLLLGGNSSDEDGGTPGIQVSDAGGTGATLYYSARSFNAACPVEGP